MQVLAKNLRTGDTIRHGSLIGTVRFVEPQGNGWVVVNVQGGYALDVLAYASLTVLNR